MAKPSSHQGRTYRSASIHAQVDSVVRANCYEYSPKRGWKPLQRLAFWFLAKIGAQVFESITVFTRTEKQHDSLLESLLSQRMAWRELIWNHNGKVRIYLGPSDEMDLIYNNGMQPYTVIATTSIGKEQELRWFDIPITTVPWLTEAVLVPERK